MNARAPIDATRVWPMWIQVAIRSVIGVMSGAGAIFPSEPRLASNTQDDFHDNER